MNLLIRLLRSPSMLLLAVAAPLLLQNARATLYLTEPFDYPSPEPLTNAVPWSTNATAVETGTPTLFLVSGDLYYPPLTDPLPVNHTRLQWSSNHSGERQIPGGPIGGPASGTSVYASFIFYQSTTNGTTANTPIVGVCVNPTETINQAAVNGPVLYYNQNGGVGFYRLGIKVGGGTTGMAYPPGTQVYATGNTNTASLSFGQTNFIVMKYTFSSTGTPGSDTVQLWVNPNSASFGGSEPAATTNDVAAINNGTDATGPLDYVQVRAASGGVAAGTPQMDDLRIGTTWADVTPTCSPAGITAPPTNQVVSPGQTATFSVAATGAFPTYQWQTNNGSGWVNIGGATSLSYTTPPTVTGNNGLQFQVIVSVSCDSTVVTSTPPAVLTVESCVPASAGATMPVSPTINQGDSTNFSITAGGSSPTYQWQTNNGSGWVNIGGATSSGYTTPSEPLANNGLQFQCVVSVACDSTTATSTPAMLNVQCNQAGVLTQPNNAMVIAGQSGTFSIVASGSDPTYQWATNNGVSGFINIIGATNASYTTPPETTGNSGLQFQCTVSVACDGTSQTSDSANLAVNCVTAEFNNNAPNGGEPSSTAVAVGQTATFSVTSDSSNPTYQWQTNNGGIFVNIGGATSVNYTTPPVTAGNNNEQFQCVVSEPCDNSVSNSSVAILSVYPANGYFQSINDSTLNSPNTWQVSYDGGITWSNPAPLAPSYGDETNVTVENGYTVENTTNVTLGNVVVQSGCEITVDAKSTLTITNLQGTGLNLAGTVDTSGTVSVLTNSPSAVASGGLMETEPGGTVTASAGSLTFTSGSTFQDNHTTNVDTIPTATWNAGSTLLIAGFTTDTATFTAAAGQTLDNFIWDCTAQTSQLPFGGNAPTNVDGNLTIESTGTGEIRLANNNSPIWNVGGNLSLLAGQLTMASGATGKPVINVSNNVYIASGAVLSNSLPATSSGTINFDGAGAQTYTNQGTIIGQVDWVVRNGSILTASGIISSNLTLASGGEVQLSTANTNLFTVAGNITGSNSTVIVNLGGSHLGAGTYPLLDFGGVFSGSLVPSIVNGTVMGTPAIDAGLPNMISLAVLSGSPKVSSFGLSGTNLSISGSSGTPGVSYGVLESTNLLLPLSQWTLVGSGAFNNSGTFNTNVVSSGAAQEFLIIRSPSP